MIPISENLLLYVIALNGTFLVVQNLAVTWNALFRFSQAYPGRLHDFFEKSPWIYVIYAAVYVFDYCVFMSAFGRITKGEEARPQFLRENPDLVVFSQDLIFCLTDRKQIHISSFLLIIFLCTFLILGILMLIVLFTRIKNNKTMHKTTYKLQIMLFRALMTQVFIGYTFLLIPGNYIFFDPQNKSKFT
jgi:hypothetical protein